MIRKFHTGLRILMYHRFHASQVDTLDRQCRHLRRYYQPVSMGEVAAAGDGRSLPSNAVAVTVDDGYHDFLDHAFPVFEAQNIPTTVFLVSGFLDREEWLWWDPLKFALERTLSTSLEFGEIGTMPIATAEQRMVAFERATTMVKGIPDGQRRRLLTAAMEQLAVVLPKETPGEFRPLSWEETRQLRKSTVEFGAHTRTHPILSRLETPAQLEEEVRTPKLRIEHELGEPVLHFCYPNGLPEDYNDAVVQTVKQCGYATAVTTSWGLNRPIDSPLRLSRIAVDASLPDHYFAELVAGMHG